MFERMLVEIDGSEPSDEALTAAIGVAKLFGSEVELVHVQGHKLTWAADLDLETHEEAFALVNVALHELQAGGVEARGEVVYAEIDQTPREIVGVAEDTDASLVVMGTRGFGDAKALVLNSVAHAVLHRAPCPVLLTPQGNVRDGENLATPDLIELRNGL